MKSSLALILALLAGLAPASSNAQPESLRTVRAPREAPVRRDVAPRETTPAAGPVVWEPIVEMDDQVFPSFILARAGSNEMLTDETQAYFGDSEGFVGVALTTPHARTQVEVRVSATPYSAATTYTATLAQAGRRYEVFPEMAWDYVALRNNQRQSPVNFVVTLLVDGEEVGEIVKVARVRSIDECPLFYVHRSGSPMDLHWMAAAYVDEDHPMVDRLLREAIDTRIVTSFDGYQSGDVQQLWRQVFAIWNVMQRRGLTYSNVATTSSRSDVVFSQRVRSLSEALATSQANCIDGAVLFASILRRLAIDPYLVLVPGHAYVGFYLDARHESYAALETTMMGQLDLRGPGGIDRPESLRLVGAEQQQSWTSFSHAVEVGNRQYEEHQPHLAAGETGYMFIDIATVRANGVHPIGR